MPKTFSKQEIEELFLKTTSGFYLDKCAKNDPGDAKGFYDNQILLDNVSGLRYI